MTLELSPELESIIADRARLCGTTPESYVEQIVAQHVRQSVSQPIAPLSSSSVEKLKRIKAVARDCGVSLSDEQLSREHMYD
jgi:hypothetical protein